MRIALSGSGGTGKTTTLKALNESLKLPVIKEGVRSYMADNNITHLRELSLRDIMKMQMELLKQKRVSEAQQEFIADRSTIDNFVYANYWLGRDDEMQRGLYDYMDSCFQHAVDSYDYIFLFPWGVIDLEDDGVRSAKPMYQFAIQMMIERAVFQLQALNPDVYVHMVTGKTVEERVDEISNIIESVELIKSNQLKEAIESEPTSSGQVECLVT